MTQILFLGNFDFEHDLAAGRTAKPDSKSAYGGHGGRRTSEMRRRNAELASVWTAMAQDDDAIWLDETVDKPFAETLQTDGLAKVRFVSAAADLPADVAVWPWGWTRQVAEICDARGWRYSAPNLESVARVNSRYFAFEMEREWSFSLPGSRMIDEIGKLNPAIEEMSCHADQWVIKAEFGMSGRERMLGCGETVSESLEGWARKRIEQGQKLFIEPWVERVAEAGLQYTVRPDGPPVFEGATKLHSNSRGQYAGSQFGLSPEAEREWFPAIQIGLQVAHRAGKAGYFGPLGLDAMQYRDDEGEIQLRPFQDINARFTMGALSLNLKRLLQAGETGLWLHARWLTDRAKNGEQWLQDFVRHLPSDCRVIRTSPWFIDHQPVRYGTFAVLGPLETIEQIDILSG